MKTLKAIETHYKGYQFRSRLEARWAVFFDSLGIEWEYESEGYDLEGVWYLPDFWLPTFNGGMYVEVKPNRDLKDEELNKIGLLTKHTKKEVWLARGVPEMKHHLYFFWSEKENDFFWQSAIPLICEAKNENRMYYHHHHLTDDKGFLKGSNNWLTGRMEASEIYPHLYNAVNNAKSARF